MQNLVGGDGISSRRIDAHDYTLDASIVPNSLDHFPERSGRNISLALDVTVWISAYDLAFPGKQCNAVATAGCRPKIRLQISLIQIG